MCSSRRSFRVTASAEGSGIAVLVSAGGEGIDWQRSSSRTNTPRSVGEELTAWACRPRKLT